MLFFESLELSLIKEFGAISRPVIFYHSTGGLSERYSAEFSALQEFCWENDLPGSLAKIYEPSTFITPEAYKYLIPRVFLFCKKWEKDVFNIDFLDVFFSLPLLDVGRIGIFRSYSAVQKYLVWEFLLYGDHKFYFGCLREDPEGTEVIRKRLLGT